MRLPWVRGHPPSTPASLISSTRPALDLACFRAALQRQARGRTRERAATASLRALAWEGRKRGFDREDGRVRRDRSLRRVPSTAVEKAEKGDAAGRLQGRAVFERQVKADAGSVRRARVGECGTPSPPLLPLP